MAISCDTDALAALARCFSCLSPVTLQEIQTYLLCQLANSGGGGGGSGDTFITSGAADPVADPGIAAAMYINTTTYSAWEWNDAAGAWRMFYSGAKVYRALLNQSGTNAPVATVLENTIGAVVWTRDDVGSYFATLAGAFTANKTFLRVQNAVAAESFSGFWISANWASANVVRVTTADGTATPADDIIAINSPVEILVYP